MINKSKKSTRATNKRNVKKEIEEDLIYQDVIKQKNIGRSINKSALKNVRLSDKQKMLFNEILNNRITIVTGPAGCSKTFTSCYAAIKLLLDDECFVNKILITKPTETIGTNLGALPGTLDEKISVYKECFINNMTEMLDGKTLEMLTLQNIIEFKAVQYIRGITMKNCILLIDEFESFDIKELMAIVTRLGSNCKMVFMGDIEQSDINKKYVGFNSFIEILRGIEGIGIFEFERKDIVRDPILIEITDRYEKMKVEGKLSQNKKNT